MSTKKLIWILALARLVLPFLLQHPVYQPHRDEFLYLDYAHHLDWGYMEVPPLLSLFSWLSQWAGHTTFWVKIWPAIFGSATFLLCSHMVLQLGGNRWSIWLMWCAFTFGAYLRLFHLFQPGFLEVFCWTAIAYTFFQFHHTQRKAWLWGFGLACGLGMMSKYTTAFFITGVMVGILATRHRKVFTEGRFWGAVALALLIFAPNLWWQYSHRWPVLHHMEELRSTQLVNISPLSFLADQLLMNLPGLMIWGAGLWYAARNPALRWLAWTWVVVLGLFMAGGGKGYYALGLYPMLMSIGAARLGPWMAAKAKPLRWAVAALPLLLGIPILPLAMPILPPEKLAAYYARTGMNQSPFFVWEDLQRHPLPQDFADMIGWRETAEMVARQWHGLPESMKRETLLYCRGYYTAGALNFHRQRLGLPQAYSDNGSYLWWMPEQFNFSHLMLVGHQNPGADDEVFNHFRSRRIADSLHIPLFRENGIKVYLFEDADSVMNRLAAQGIAEEKMKFTRQ